MVAVLKDTSVILDLRATNAACLKLPAQLPSQQEIFSLFTGKRFVTGCDIANFFFTVPVKKEKRPLFCFFDTQNVRKQLNVMPQGFRNSSAYAAQLTGKLLEGMNTYHAAFVDDIWVATPELSNYDHGIDFHLHQIELLFQRLIAARLRIKPGKFEPLRDSLEILGYLYEAGQFSIPEHRVKAIQAIPLPNTHRAVRSFLALVSYFRMFCKNYAKYCVPILEVQKKAGKTIIWTDPAKKAFEQIKNLVSNAIKISAPMFDREFLMSVDASLYAHGSILYQLDDNEVAIYLGATSKVFSATERNASSFYREIMCLVASLLHFNFYLEFADAITVFTDAISILWLKAIRQGHGKLFRLALIMSAYELTIKHVPHNKDAWAADILSRLVDIDRIIDHQQTLTVDQADRLFALVQLPDGFVISNDTLKEYLNSNGIKNPFSKGKKKTVAKVNITPANFKPQQMPKKKENLPKSSPYHPLYPEQHNQKHLNTTDFTRPGTNQEPETDEHADMEVEQEFGQEQSPIDLVLATLVAECREAQQEKYYPVELKDTTDEDIFFALNSCVMNLVDSNCASCSSCSECALQMDHGPFCNLMTITLMGQHTLTPDASAPQRPPQNVAEKGGDEFESSALDTFRLNDKIIAAGKITVDTLREAQSSCPYVQQIARQTPLPIQYFYRTGVLLHSKNNKETIVLPKNLLLPMIHHFHQSFWGNHQRPDKIYELVSKLYHANDMKQWIQEFLPNCPLCLTEKLNTRRLLTIGKMTAPKYPRERWHLDLSFGFQPVMGYNGIAVFVEAFSLYTVARPIKTKNADELVTIFRDHVWAPFNCRELLTDGEKAISSKVFDDFCTERNITQLKTSAFSAWQNAAAEITIKLLKTAIRIYSKSCDLSWVKVLPDVLVGFNKRALSSKHTPEEILFGNITECGEPLEATVPFETFDNYMEYFLHHVHTMRKAHIARRSKLADRVRASANKSKKEHVYAIGDIVYLKELTIAQDVGRSMRSAFIGPYEIVEVHPNTKHCTLENVNTFKRRLAHFAHLKPTQGKPNLQAPAHTDVPGLLRNTPEKAAESRVHETMPEPRRSERIKSKKDTAR